MNDLVKTSIDGRKNAIFSAYNVTEQSIIEKINELFIRINEFGESCADNMDFETRFATSPLNQEYIGLFTEIATTCTPIVRQVEERHVKSDEEYKKEEIESEIRYQAREATMPIRRQMHEETLKAARNAPVIGEILEAKQYMDFFGRFKKKKKNKEDNKEQ